MLVNNELLQTTIHNFYHVLHHTKKLEHITKIPNNFIPKSNQTVLTYEFYSSDPVI